MLGVNNPIKNDYFLDVFMYNVLIVDNNVSLLGILWTIPISVGGKVI